MNGRQVAADSHLSTLEMFETQTGRLTQVLEPFLKRSTCTADAQEPNDTSDAAYAAGPGVLMGRICPADEDVFAVTLLDGESLTAQLDFTHSAGDLDLTLSSSNGSVFDTSQSVGNSETVSASHRPAGAYYVRVYGYAGATGPYTLTLTQSDDGLGNEPPGGNLPSLTR